MFIIRTPLGDAIRSCDDATVNEGSDIIQLKPEACCSLVPEPLLRSSTQISMYSRTDLPDPYRVRTEISNVCGFVAGVRRVCRFGDNI